LAGFVAGLLIVSARSVQLEVTQGDGFRDQAVRPLEKKTVLPAPRGRILARDGSPLAFDRVIHSVAVQYRWLQTHADPRWLRITARARLAKADRKNATKLAAAQAAVLAERAALAERLTALCGLSPAEWASRTREIQTRVQHIAESANERRQSATNDRSESDDPWARRVRRLLLEDPPPPRIIVAEELAPHVVADDASTEVMAAIQADPDRFPGTTLVEQRRRLYPRGRLAAHVIGHLGAVRPTELAGPSASPSASGDALPGYRPDDLVGRMGVERQYEIVLHGRHGLAIERSDRGGRRVTSFHAEEPAAGRDVRLTIDAILQETAEALLQSARERGQSLLAVAGDAGLNGSGIAREAGSEKTGEGGPISGAIVVMELRDGAIRAAASTPTFDPNVFARGKADEVAVVLADPSRPLFDRVCRMAIPPGSTFKVAAAAALLESHAVAPDDAFACQGYLHRPDQQRCELYVRQGIGHGDVRLSDALALSCNVYFYHFAVQMGARPLLDWAERFGFGRPTGIDLPDEAAGSLLPPAAQGATRDPASRARAPTPSGERLRLPENWRTFDTQSLAIGQGWFTATPLQVLRMMAAVANGGRLVTPYVREPEEAGGNAGAEGHRDRSGAISHAATDAVVSFRTLQILRQGLRRVVADPHGTAHATVYLPSVAVAGKTGTAETGEDGASHAWFAGYVPADAPKLAFVVVLEHGGDAATAAGPLAKRLVVRMEQLGML
jgi:penicillin-binding protein 2